MELHAVKYLVGSLGAVKEVSQYGSAFSISCALVRLCDESSSRLDKPMIKAYGPDRNDGT